MSNSIFDRCNAEVGEGPPKPDWGDVGVCGDADVDPEGDGGTIIVCCGACDCACDCDDLVDVRCGVLVARAGVER